MPAEPKLREARWVPSNRRASLPSGLPVPAGSLFGSIAAPASGSRSGPSSTRHRCRPLPIPSGPLPWPASLPPASGFLPGSSRSIAAPLGSLRVAARASLPVQVPAAANRSLGLACRRFAVPSGPKAFRFRRVQRESGSGSGFRLCLTLLPSSPCRCCALSFSPCGPPGFAPPLQPPGAFFRPGLSPLASGRSRPRGEAVTVRESRKAQSTCG